MEKNMSSVPTGDQVVPVGKADRERKANLLVALSIEVGNKRAEKTQMNKQLNEEIKELDKKIRDTAKALEATGQFQLSMFEEQEH